MTVPDENKIRVSTDIADRMKGKAAVVTMSTVSYCISIIIIIEIEDILISYLNQSSRLEHTR